MSTGRPPAPEVASTSTSASVVGARDPADRRHHAGGGLVVRPGVDVDAGLGPRRAGGCRWRDSMTVGLAEERRLLGRGRRTSRRTRRRTGAGCARGSGRTWRCPRTRSRRRCRAPPRSRRAARTARRRPRAPGRRGSSPGPGGARCRAGRCRSRRARRGPRRRTLEGPAPKRPSAGRRSAGMVIVSVTVAATSWQSRAGDLTSLSAGARLVCHPQRTGSTEGDT